MLKLKEEIKVILIYLIIGLIWIYFSDALLMIFVSDINQISELQMYKGIFYIFFTAAIFYFLCKKYFDNLRKQKLRLKENNEQLKEYNEEIKVVNSQLDNSLNDLEKLNQRFIKMINSISSLNQNSKIDEEEFLSNLLHNIIEVVPEADYGKIYILENEKCKFIDAVGHNIELLRDLEINAKYLVDLKSNNHIFSEDYSIAVTELPEKKKKVLKKALNEIKESTFININFQDRIIGRISLDIAKTSKKFFNEGTVHILESFSTLASSFFAYKRFDKLQGEFTKELITSIIKILEIYDVYTKGHSENVADLSLLIAEEMGLSETKALDSYWAGMVHDIGKLLVPVRILNKKGKLEEFEYNLIKKHPVWSSQALSDSETLKHISKYVLYHHERWDGSGYPEGLKAEEIPLISQIIAVADAWDAMTSHRSYRDSLPEKEALKEIKKNRNSQFSPRVVDVFLKVVEEKKFDFKTKIESKIKNLKKREVNWKTKEQFEILFEKTQNAVAILNENFKIKRVNNYFIKLFEYQESEILGQNIIELLSPIEKKHEVKDNLNKLFARGEINMQSSRKKKNGKMVAVEIQAFPFALSNDEVEYAVIYQDISRLASVRNKYENYKGRYEALFENESTVMLIIDPNEGQIIDANPAAVNFYGWSRKKLKSMKISEINALSEAEIRAEMRAAKVKDKKHFDFIHKTNFGDYKEVQVYSQPITFRDHDLLYSIIHSSDEVRVKS